MKKQLFYLIISVIVCSISSCESSYDNDIFPVKNSDFESNETSRSSLEDKNAMSLELAKYIKFENNTHFISLTKEEALNLGISYDVYDQWSENLIKRNKDVQEIISNGGKYSFYNQLANPTKNESKYSDLFKNQKNNSLFSLLPNYEDDTVRGDGGGILSYPSNNIVNVVFTYTYYSGIFFTYSAQIEGKKSHQLISYPVSMWYKCVLTYKGSDEIETPHDVSILGSSIGTTYSECIPFPGPIGINEKPHKIFFEAEFEPFNTHYNDTIQLREAYCKWSPSRK